MNKQALSTEGSVQIIHEEDTTTIWQRTNKDTEMKRFTKRIEVTLTTS